MATTRNPVPTPVDASLRATTIVELFRHRARSRPDAVALRHHDDRGGWKDITWRAYEKAAAEVAAGLQAWGLETGDRWAFRQGQGGLVTSLYGTRVMSEAIRRFLDGELSAEATAGLIQLEVESLR